MDILTRENTNNFIRKLQRYSPEKDKKDKALSVLEPRGFDIILRRLGCKKVLELERVSDSCEQICKKHNIDYQGVYVGIKNRSYIKEWDGDIICGPTGLKHSGFIAIEALKKLKPGRFFAYYLPFNFMESWTRYKNLLRETPFQTLYITPTKLLVSSDNNFEGMYPTPYPFGWYVWEGGSEQKTPEIKWLDELWDEYFVTNEAGYNLKLRHERVYKNPIKVTIDLGRGKHLT